MRVQWDPYHDIGGKKMTDVTRCIQIGLRGRYNELLATNKSKFTEEGNSGLVIFIEDITEFVKQQYKSKLKGEDVYIPEEAIYELNNNDIKKIISF
jgi:hypothetical protein